MFNKKKKRIKELEELLEDSYYEIKRKDNAINELKEKIEKEKKVSNGFAKVIEQQVIELNELKKNSKNKKQKKDTKTKGE